MVDLSFNPLKFYEINQNKFFTYIIKAKSMFMSPKLNLYMALDIESNLKFNPIILLCSKIQI